MPPVKTELLENDNSNNGTSLSTYSWILFILHTLTSVLVPRAGIINFHWIFLADFAISDFYHVDANSAYVRFFASSMKLFQSKFYLRAKSLAYGLTLRIHVNVITKVAKG